MNQDLALFQQTLTLAEKYGKEILPKSELFL